MPPFPTQNVPVWIAFCTVTLIYYKSVYILPVALLCKPDLLSPKFGLAPVNEVLSTDKSD